MVAKTESELTKADENRLQKHLENIDRLKNTYNTSIVGIGQELAGVLEVLPNGKTFVEWVDEKCHFSKTTAYAYVAAFRTFGKFSRLEHFEDSALTALAGCDEAASEAKKIASRGGYITHKKAKELLDEFKPKPAKSKPSKPASSPEVPGLRPEPSSTSQDGNGAAAGPQKPCEHLERDEDGDCTTCYEPAKNLPPLPKSDDDAGGWEPEEAKKPLEKLTKSLGEAIRHCFDAKKILGEPERLVDAFNHLDAASVALAQFRKSFKRKAK